LLTKCAKQKNFILAIANHLYIPLQPALAKVFSEFALKPFAVKGFSVRQAAFSSSGNAGQSFKTLAGIGLQQF
jgi:hypothetical protein